MDAGFTATLLLLVAFASSSAQPQSETSGIFSGILDSLTSTVQAKGCPGECVHTLTALFCERVLESAQCDNSYYKCCVPNDQTNFGTVVETSPPLTDDGTIVSSPQPIDESPPYHEDSGEPDLEQDTPPPLVNTHSPPVNTPSTSVVSTEAPRVQGPKIKCPGLCVEEQFARYCARTVANSYCPDKDKMCCLPDNVINVTTVAPPVTKTSPIPENFEQNTEAPEPEGPPCPGSCVVGFFSLLCDKTLPDYHCSEGGTCCINGQDSPTTTTEVPVEPCPGKCILTVFSGVCNRPSELILKTTDCGGGTICCYTPLNAHPPEPQRLPQVPGDAVETDRPQPPGFPHNQPPLVYPQEQQNAHSYPMNHGPRPPTQGYPYDPHSGPPVHSQQRPRPSLDSALPHPHPTQIYPPVHHPRPPNIRPVSGYPSNNDQRPVVTNVRPVETQNQHYPQPQGYPYEQQPQASQVVPQNVNSHERPQAGYSKDQHVPNRYPPQPSSLPGPDFSGHQATQTQHIRPQPNPQPQENYENQQSRPLNSPPHEYYGQLSSSSNSQPQEYHDKPPQRPSIPQYGQPQNGRPIQPQDHYGLPQSQRPANPQPQEPYGQPQENPSQTNSPANPYQQNIPSDVQSASQPQLQETPPHGYQTEQQNSIPQDHHAHSQTFVVNRPRPTSNNQQEEHSPAEDRPSGSSNSRPPPAFQSGYPQSFQDRPNFPQVSKPIIHSEPVSAVQTQDSAAQPSVLFPPDSLVQPLQVPTQTVPPNFQPFTQLTPSQIQPLPSRPLGTQDPVFVRPKQKPQKPQRVSVHDDGNPSCPGPCMAAFLRFTCYGNNAFYNGFSCAKEGLTCCAPIQDIQKQEEILRPGAIKNATLANLAAATATTTTVAPSTPPIVMAPTRRPVTRHHPCGVKGTKRLGSGRVVGGSEAGPDEWCWQVALLNGENQYLCGGSLIGSQWVLTAAHCVTNLVRKGEPIFVRVGDHNLKSNYGSPKAQTQRVVTTYIHHNHNGQTLDNDIALLKLQTPTEISEGVCLVCLPARGSKHQIGKKCVVTGYGYQGEAGPIALKVREAEIPIVDEHECTKKINDVTEKTFILPASSFCAGGEEGNDACQGDGGGPLVCKVDNYYELTGLVSWGFGCGRSNVPGVYVKVSSFIGWINQIISVNNS